MVPGMLECFFSDLENRIENRLIKFVDEFNLLKRIKTELLMKGRFSIENELGKLEKAVRNELNRVQMGQI